MASLAAPQRASAACNDFERESNRMDSWDEALEHLAGDATCGYHAGSVTAAEPTALAALALLGHGRIEAAQRHLDWLASHQAPDGMVAVEEHQPSPGWATGWAVVAWQCAAATSHDKYQPAIEHALSWILSVKGSYIPYIDRSGHDTTIIGWPWVEGTHSWLEPTAINVLALRHAGRAAHPRTREGVCLLLDRLLPQGGCNYGNTVVFGQELRAHLEPTGLCLLGLYGQKDPRGRLARSIEFLKRELSSQTTSVSLAYGLMGLTAQDARPPQADQWLAAAVKRTLSRDAGGYPLALLALAALGTNCPLTPIDNREPMEVPS